MNSANRTENFELMWGRDKKMMLKITKLERDSTQTKLNYEQLHQSIKFETLISKQNLIFICGFGSFTFRIVYHLLKCSNFIEGWVMATVYDKTKTYFYKTDVWLWEKLWLALLSLSLLLSVLSLLYLPWFTTLLLFSSVSLH